LGLVKALLDVDEHFELLNNAWVMH
jgi:hypothetical protein